MEILTMILAFFQSPAVMTGAQLLAAEVGMRAIPTPKAIGFLHAGAALVHQGALLANEIDAVSQAVVGFSDKIFTQNLLTTAPAPAPVPAPTPAPDAAPAA